MDRWMDNNFTYETEILYHKYYIYWSVLIDRQTDRPEKTIYIPAEHPVNVSSE